LHGDQKRASFNKLYFLQAWPNIDILANSMQHTFKNVVPIQLSLYLHSAHCWRACDNITYLLTYFCLLHLLLNISDVNVAKRNMFSRWTAGGYKRAGCIGGGLKNKTF